VPGGVFNAGGGDALGRRPRRGYRVGGRRRPLGTQLGWLGQWAETLLGLRDKGEGDGLQPLGLN
jgi:hypothetical protein